MNRRGRLIAGLELWASARPTYRLKLGTAPISFDILSDEALAELRTRIARDVRSERQRHPSRRAA